MFACSRKQLRKMHGHRCVALRAFWSLDIGPVADATGRDMPPSGLISCPLG